MIPFSEILLIEFQKKVSFEDGISSANPSEPTIINETSQSKFHGDDSIVRPKSSLSISMIQLKNKMVFLSIKCIENER
jgi:hypothetical protein